MAKGKTVLRRKVLSGTPPIEPLPCHKTNDQDNNYMGKRFG